MTVVTLKTSRRFRKAINEMRGMADVPWPARRFKYPPTLAPMVLGKCERMVEVQWERRGKILGWVRKPLPKPVPCGGELILVPFQHRVECVDCKRRAMRERLQLRVAQPPWTALNTLHALVGVLNVTSRMFRRKAG